MVAGLNVAAITDLLKELDLEGLGSGIGAALAGNNDSDSTPTPVPPTNGVNTGATRVLPGKEIIIPINADSSEARDEFSRSLSGLSQDLDRKLQDIRQRTEIATSGSPREQAYRQEQLRSDIARDRFTAMPTRTAWEDVNQFREPFYRDPSVSDLEQSRIAAKDSWLDAADIAAVRKNAAYPDNSFVPSDKFEIQPYEKKGWEYFPEGLKGMPVVGSDEWKALNQVNFDGVQPDIGLDQPYDPVPIPSIEPLGQYDEWINQQYRELLGRDAGTEGLNYWTGDLERGQTKQQVIDNIKRSEEYKNLNP